MEALVAEAPAGVGLEDKGSSIAVHTRRTAHPDATLAALIPSLQRIAADHDLLAEPGKLILEIRGRGMDKGIALRELVRATGSAAVLYAGDDLGDLPAFAAVKQLRADGLPAVGVAVASEGADAAVAQAADETVSGPPALLEVLRRIRA